VGPHDKKAEKQAAGCKHSIAARAKLRDMNNRPLTIANGVRLLINRLLGAVFCTFRN
jgi:hypothetical protein